MYKTSSTQYGGVGGKPATCDPNARIKPDVESRIDGMNNLKEIRNAELSELKNFSPAFDNVEFDMPSYCDRIIYRISHEDKIKIIPEAYDSYVNSVIAKSSHDMVYGIYQIQIAGNSLKLLIVSWNQSSQSATINDILDKGFFTKIKHTGLTDFDIICVAQQESEMYDVFVNVFNSIDMLQGSIIDYIKTNMTSYKVFHSKTGVPGFYVRLSVLIKSSLTETDFDTTIKTTCLRLPFCDKSIVGIGLNFRVIPLTINLFSTQFPTDVELRQREKVVDTVNKFIFNNFTNKHINQMNQVDFIIGDLNFRYNRGAIVGDQLDSVMGKWKSLRGFVEPERKFGPTCKLIKCNIHKK